MTLIDRLRGLLADSVPAHPPGGGDGADARLSVVELAAASLLLATVHADFASDAAEHAALAEALARTFGRSSSEVSALIANAATELDRSVSLHDFTRLLNAELDYPGKLAVVEAMWRVAFADRRLESHEEHLLRRVANLLHVPHADFIRAKQNARSTVAGSAGAEAAPAPTAAAPSAARIAELVAAFMAAFDRNDLDAVMSFFDDEAVYDQVLGQSATGKAAIRDAFLPQFQGAFGRMRFEQEDLVVDAARGAAVLTWRCWFERKGQPSSWRGLDLLIFRGERLVRKSTYAKAERLLLS